MKYGAYRRYKATALEWVGDIPEHWDVTKLKHCVRMSDRKIEVDSEFARPYIGLEHVESWTGKVTTAGEERAPHEVAKEFSPTSVLFGKLRPYLAKAATPGFHGVCSSEFLVLDAEALEQRFLLYVLLSQAFIDRVNSSTYGAKMPRAEWEFIGSCVVAIPPRPEQNAIAQFLDTQTAKLDALIEKKRAFIGLLKERRSALISRVVTRGLPPEAARAAGLDPNPKLKPSGVEWLGDVPENWHVGALKWESPILRGASPRPIDDPVYFDEGGKHAWVRIADVTASGTYLTKTTQRLSELGSSLSVKLEPGAVFLSIAGSVGKPCITTIPCCIHDGFVYFPRWRGDARFLYYVFESGEPYQGLGKLGTQLNLNTDTVGSIRIGVPPLTEQRAISDFLDRHALEIQELHDRLAQTIRCLEEYRSALITAAVTGQIDVRPPPLVAPLRRRKLPQ